MTQTKWPPEKPGRFSPVIERMRHYAALYPRFGYRRIHVYLEREGIQLGWDRMLRLWRLAKLQVPKKRSRRRVSASRPRPVPATGPNQVWAYDFVFDACANGQQLKCLVITDEWTHEALAIDVQGSIRSSRVIDVLSRLVSLHGAPRYLVGPEESASHPRAGTVGCDPAVMSEINAPSIQAQKAAIQRISQRRL
ncbi:MAG: hypothetical protein KatS3mg082_2768 [Nitrospiraceae bacterium]|nr:MAG: hypothetical protein KatS3mg082_2768 [Nitrospiraceae bacterium]